MPSFSIPREVPVMTLSGVVFFPQAMLPLHIFEPRYRQMLEDVLEGERIFCVAGQNESLAEDDGRFEPPYEIASVGIVRASHQNDDGTSNLILQGLTRVRVRRIIREEPYRLAEIEPLICEPGTDPETLAAQKRQLIKVLKSHARLGGRVPEEVLAFLEKVDDADAVIDLAAFTLCSDDDEKQHLLEILDTQRRYAAYLDYLSGENARLALDKQLRGELKPGDADRN